ncbi:MAG: (2Fe-2S)-binding protein [Leptolyngbyaceae cyanobacterium MAG.088]|nr:(2Fe-2S)-binding protein [Leptolyngbyaceae cyanobacterium MAG.088]
MSNLPILERETCCQYYRLAPGQNLYWKRAHD